MKNIAETIKEGREKLGLTQEELASKLFVTRQAVSGWERGKNLPDIEKLKLISEMFSIPLDTMLFKDNENVRKSNVFYRYIATCFVVVLFSLVSIGVYQVFNPPHIVLLRVYEGVCTDENVTITYREDENRYLVKTMENVSFDFGEYCIPLSFEIIVDPANSKITELEQGYFGTMGVSQLNPKIRIEEKEGYYLFKYYSYFQVFEQVSFNRLASRMIHSDFTGIYFEVPFDMKDGESITVIAERTNDWMVIHNE